jgi:hypothetical protein
MRLAAARLSGRGVADDVGDAAIFLDAPRCRKAAVCHINGMYIELQGSRKSRAGFMY